MILQNKILPVALVASLLGGTVGAFVTRSTSTTEPATTSTTTTTQPAANTTATDQTLAGQNALNLTEEQVAYRDGFTEGFNAAQQTTRSVVTQRTTQPTRVVYQAPRRQVVRSNNTRRAYYDYEQRRERSFWDKHRDKLTVAMGTGAGAAIGGLVGGKKGAAIGALAGAGGSALYTYKIRKRDRQY
ncbi:MAG TPA: hypothetical protein VD966_01340 [Pyrinomonadaceae bacterium]|nr:hypothetical protein [Pyrinomonadaceae bacterium]